MKEKSGDRKRQNASTSRRGEEGGVGELEGGMGR